MTDKQYPDVDDVKIRLSKDEIPVDDETVYKSDEEGPDVVDELRLPDVGRHRQPFPVRSDDAGSGIEWPV